MKGESGMKYVLVLWLVLFAPSSGAADGVPSDFSPTVGDALLCLDKIDPVYFNGYLQASFGPPYKTVGDRKWYRVDEKLWGKEQVTDVIVGDTPPFLGAIIQDSSQGTAAAILATIGIRYAFDNGDGVSPEYGEITLYNGLAEVFCQQN